MKSAVYIENISRDLLYALRTMRKSPAFAVTAVLTLALGIGGNTAIFSVIHAVLLKPLGYRDPDRLVYFSMDNSRRNVKDGPFSALQLEEMRTAARSFTAIGAFLHSVEDMTWSGGGQTEALKGARVSANFLDILAVRPVVGRSFLPEEDRPGGPPVAMIGSGLWKRRFDGDPQVAGKTATLDSVPCTIVGVLPEGFAFPFAGVDVWVPRPSEWSILPSRYWRGVTLLSGFARLKPNVTLEQALAEMEVLNRQYILAHPSNLEMDSTPRMVRLKDRLVANARPMLWMLFGAVGLVLLIACANVASLLMVRAASRSREFAVRAAIGASRGRLIRQLLAESLVLAVAGGALGVLLAKWGLSAITHWWTLSRPSTRVMPLYLSGGGQIRLDGMVLGFTVTLSIVTGLLFGLFPSLQVSRPDLMNVLRESGGASGTYGRRRLLGISPRGLLVMAQVALSVVLLIGAALLMQSFVRLNNVDPGFRVANLLTMKIALPAARYDTDRKKSTFFEELMRRVEALPGVRGATMAMSLPTTVWIRTNITSVEGQPEPDLSEQAFAVLQSVTPGYFQTLGIPLQRGREFTARDNTPGAPPVMIVNESLARRLWPDYPRGQDPVGQHISEGYDKRVGRMEVAGVVADIHEGSLASDAVPEFYLPCVVHPPQSAYLAVRTIGDPLRFAGAIRSQVLAIDRDQPVSDIRTM